MKHLPTVTATVLAILLVGAGVGSVTAFDTGATDVLGEQRQPSDSLVVSNAQPSDRPVGDTSRVDRIVGDTSRLDRLRGPGFEVRVAGIGGDDWLDDLDDFLTVFDLTDTERDAVVDEAEEMRADGATAADVHHMVHYRLYQHGYDTRDVHAYAVAYRLGEEFDLTDEQVTELATGIVDELDAGADRAELRQYVRETLEEFGVSDEEIRSAVVEHRLRALAERHDLTDDQTDELVEGALELVDEGANRAELREYVRETLEEFGVSDDRRDRDRRDRERDRDDRDRERDDQGRESDNRDRDSDDRPGRDDPDDADA